jgi:hypothetical protein
MIFYKYIMIGVEMIRDFKIIVKLLGTILNN